MWPLSEKYGVSQVYVDQLGVLAQNIVDNRIDCLGIFVGSERFGKSTLISRTAKILTELMHVEIKLKRDYHYELDEFVKDLLQTKFDDNKDAAFPAKGGKHYIKVYDEPVLGANARRWASKGNIILNSTLAVIGYKYYFILAGIPNPWMLDTNVRTQRAAFLARVRGKVDNTGYIQKGYFDLYNGPALKRIYRDAKTNETIYPPTRFSELRFESMEGTDFWKEYEVFSPHAKQNAINELIRAAKLLRPKDDPFSEDTKDKIKFGGEANE